MHNPLIRAVVVAPTTERQNQRTTKSPGPSMNSWMLVAAVVLCLIRVELLSAQDCAALPRNLTLRLLDETGLDNVVRREAAAEAARIWARHHVRLEWSEKQVDPVASPSVIFVMVRRIPFARRFPDDESAHAPGTALARTPFGKDSPGRLIEVAYPTLAHFLARHPGTSPETSRTLATTLIGRALGRVIAHEIGHMLLGQGHTRDGLMKPAFDPSDLLEDLLPPFVSTRC